MRKRSGLAILFLLPLLLSGCLTPQQRMTQAAVMGDGPVLNELLVSAAPEVNTPATLPDAHASCPGRITLTPLQAASCAGHEDLARRLLASKADINLAAGAGLSPLLLAAANERDGVVQLLAQSRARLDSTDAVGNTVLMIYSKRGNKVLVAELLKNGASPSAKNRSGETALLLTSDVSIAKMLVALGANPLEVSARGESGLHMAARSGSAEMAQYFIDRGVDLGLKNKQGETALDLARGLRKAGMAEPSASGGRAERLKALRTARGEAADTAQAVDSDSTQKAAVVSVIEQRLHQFYMAELAAGDQAAQQGKASEALTQYTSALSRANDLGVPEEADLRLKIIRFAAAMPIPPAMPEKAREHLVRSSYLLNKGQDVGLVEREMVAALRLAPWWAEGYYNLGQILAGQGKFDLAVQNLKLFMAVAPSDPRAQAAQDKIFEIKIAKEEEDKIRGMKGRWLDASGSGYTVAVNGDKLTMASDGNRTFALNLKSTALDGTVEGRSYSGEHGCSIPGQVHPVTGIISPDARSISLEYLWSNYKANFHCVNIVGVPSPCCIFCDVVCDTATVVSTSKVSLQLRPAE